MRPTAVLASALVRPAVVLTTGEGAEGGGEGGEGGEGGNEGGEGGGGAWQAETVPETPGFGLVRVVSQVQTVPPMT